MEDRRLSPRDAIHVATVESAGQSPILSTDADFDDVDSVTRIDPADFLQRGPTLPRRLFVSELDASRIEFEGHRPQVRAALALKPSESSGRK